MKNSKTTLMELTRQYRNVLKKCFLINLGVILISGAAGATELPNKEINDSETVTDKPSDPFEPTYNTVTVNGRLNIVAEGQDASLAANKIILNEDSNLNLTVVQETNDITAALHAGQIEANGSTIHFSDNDEVNDNGTDAWLNAEDITLTNTNVQMDGGDLDATDNLVLDQVTLTGSMADVHSNHPGIRPYYSLDADDKEDVLSGEYGTYGLSDEAWDALSDKEKIALHDEAAQAERTMKGGRLEILNGSNITLTNGGEITRGNNGDILVDGSVITLNKGSKISSYQYSSMLSHEGAEGDIWIKNGSTINLNGNSGIVRGLYDWAESSKDDDTKTFDFYKEQGNSTILSKGMIIFDHSELNMSDTGFVAFSDFKDETAVMNLQNGSTLNVNGDNAIWADAVDITGGSEANIAAGKVLSVIDTFKLTDEGTEERYGRGAFNPDQGTVLNLEGTLNADVGNSEHYKGTVAVKNSKAAINGAINGVNLTVEKDWTLNSTDEYPVNSLGDVVANADLSMSLPVKKAEELIEPGVTHLTGVLNINSLSVSDGKNLSLTSNHLAVTDEDDMKTIDTSYINTNSLSLGNESSLNLTSAALKTTIISLDHSSIEAQDNSKLGIHDEFEIADGTSISLDRSDIVGSDDIVIAGGKIELDHDSELWSSAPDGKITISGGEITLKNDSDIVPEGTLEIKGGKITATKSQVGSIGAFGMSAGTLTLNNGVFGSEGDYCGDDSCHKGGQVTISGGTINVKPLENVESEVTGFWDYKANVLMGQNIKMSGGEMNITAGAILALRGGFEEDSILGSVSTLALTGGQLNLSGSFNGNIESGETAGTVAIKDSAAKINGNVYGVNLSINKNFSSDNLTGIINDLNNLTIAENTAFELNLDGKITGLNHNDYPDLDVESFTMGKNSTLTLNGSGSVENNDPDIDAWGDQYVTGTITLKNAGLKQNGPDGSITIEDATLSTEGGDIASRSTEHDLTITNSTVAVRDAGIFKETTGEGEEKRGSGDLNINNSSVTLSGFAVIVNSTETGDINIKDSTVTMNGISALVIGETDYDDETNQVVVSDGLYKGNIVLDNSTLNMSDTSSVLVSGVENGFELTNGSELNVKGNNSIHATSPVEIQGSVVNIDKNAKLILHKPEVRPEDGGTMHLGQGSVLNLFGTLDGNLIGNQYDKTKAGTLNVMSESSDITGIAHWLNIGLQVNSTFVGEDIFTHDLIVGNDEKKAVQLTIDGDDEKHDRATGTIASMTVKDGATVLAKTSTATWDKTGELDSPVTHGVALDITEIQVNKGATLELNGNGNHSVDISGVKTATVNGNLKLINGRLEGDDEDPSATITIDGAHVHMEGISNIEAGGAITITNSEVDANTDDHGFMSASNISVDNSIIALAGQTHMVTANDVPETEATGALRITNGSDITMKGTNILAGDIVSFDDSNITVEGEGYLTTKEDSISFANTKAGKKTGLIQIDQDASLTVLSGHSMSEIDDDLANEETVLAAYQALNPNKGTLNLAVNTMLTNNGTLNANVVNAGTVTNEGSIVGNVTNNGELTSVLSSISGSIDNNGVLNTWGNLERDIAGTTNLVRASALQKNVSMGSVNVQKSLDLGTYTLTADQVSIEANTSVAFHVTDQENFGKIKADAISVSDNGTVLNLTLGSGITLAEDETWELKVLDVPAEAGETALTGMFGRLTSNTLYDFKYVGNGLFEVANKTTPAEVISNSDMSADDKEAATAWTISVTVEMSPSAAAIADHLITLFQNNLATFKEAIQALKPDPAPTGSALATAINNQLAGVVKGRFGGPAPSGRAGGDTFKNAGLWAQGLYNKSKLDTDSGFDGKTTGLAVGADGEISEGLKVGLGYAYTTSDIDAVGRTTDVDTHTAILYAEQNIGNSFVNGMLSYGFSKYKEDKNVGGKSVRANYDMQALFGQIMTGYHFLVSDALLTPEVGMRYLRTETQSYTDTAGQHVNSNTTDTLTGVLGGRAGIPLRFGKATVTPEAKLFATYDMMTDKSSSSVRLANGASYTVDGKSLDRFGIETGLGVGMKVNNMEFSVNYEGKFKKDYSDHTGMLNLRYNF